MYDHTYETKKILGRSPGIEKTKIDDIRGPFFMYTQIMYVLSFSSKESNYAIH